MPVGVVVVGVAVVDVLVGAAVPVPVEVEELIPVDFPVLGDFAVVEVGQGVEVWEDLVGRQIL